MQGAKPLAKINLGSPPSPPGKGAGGWGNRFSRRQGEPGALGGAGRHFRAGRHRRHWRTPGDNPPPPPRKTALTFARRSAIIRENDDKSGSTYPAHPFPPAASRKTRCTADSPRLSTIAGRPNPHRICTIPLYRLSISTPAGYHKQGGYHEHYGRQATAHAGGQSA